MSYLSDLLGDAYKEGMTEDEISEALSNLPKPEPKEDPEIARLKGLLSKANSEAAGYKKQLSEKMTADERKAQEDRDKLDQLIQENQDMKKQIAISTNKAQLLSIGYADDLASATAEAMFNGDMKTIMENQKTFLEAKEKEIRADALKATPTPPAGAGTASVTKEQFDAMSLAERTELYQNSPETYAKLKG